MKILPEKKVSNSSVKEVLDGALVGRCSFQDHWPLAVQTYQTLLLCLSQVLTLLQVLTCYHLHLL